MVINKVDTNGVKPLLGMGEFGYDNYSTGGDEGRVYVGTGAENIPLAKKSELVFRNQALTLEENTDVPDGVNMVVEELLDLNGYDVVLNGSAKIRFETEI